MRNIKTLKWMGIVGLSILMCVFAVIVLIKAANTNEKKATEANETTYPTTFVITDLSELPPEIGNLTVGPSPEGFSLPEEEYQP